MTTLSTDVSARAKLFRTSDAFTLDSRLPIPVTIGSEHLSVNARTTVVVNGVNVPAVIVTRGLDGTIPATHAAGSTLTVGWGSGGGGSISATDGTTTVDPATSITAPRISDGGAGVAEMFEGMQFNSGWIISGDPGTGLASGASVQLNNASDTTGGGASLVAGDGDTGGYGNNASVIGGSGDGASPGHGGAQLIAGGGLPTGPGVLQVFTNGSGGSGGQFLGSDDNGGVVFRDPAAHLAHGSTVDQLIDALIAAGLMAAS